MKHLLIISTISIQLAWGLGGCSGAKPVGSSPKGNTDAKSANDLASKLPAATISALDYVKDLEIELYEGDLEVTWTALEDATSYNISWKLDGQPERGNETSTKPSYTISNVSPGTYVVTVIPTGPDGSGPLATKSIRVEDTFKKPEPTPPPSTPLAFSLKSTAFQNMAPIPATYVAKNGGGNMSPPLSWGSAPAGTAFFAIQMVDLDTGNPFLHWMITNIPATTTSLPAGITAGNNLAAPPEAIGANQALAYRGPNPPNLHRYEFTIYAIKAGVTLNLTNNVANNRTQLDANALNKSVLIGTYQ